MPKKNPKTHRARDRRRRAHRADPRRDRQAAPAGRLDRSRREEPRAGESRRRKDRRRLRHRRPPRAACPARSDGGDHRHRRASARRADHGGARAKAPALHREAARHRAGRIGTGPEGDPAGRRGRCDRVHAALSPPLAGGEREGAHRESRRRFARHLARVHEPAGGARQLQADQRPEPDLADGDLGDARARHRDVDDGGEDARRDLRPLGRQGARARVPRDRRDGGD